MPRIARCLHEAKNRYPMKFFAYCLMPNHFHMVLIPGKGEDLSKWMQWLGTSHVRRYHRHYGTSGHVWQGKFRVAGKGAERITLAEYYLLCVVGT